MSADRLRAPDHDDTEIVPAMTVPHEIVPAMTVPQE
jgi:hypothetical protein